MPKEYVLKKPPLDQNRLNKYCKETIDNAKDNRQSCIEAYKFFKGILAANPDDQDARKNMLDALKLVQSADVNKNKALEVLIKAETAHRGMPGSGGKTDFSWKDLVK